MAETHRSDKFLESLAVYGSDFGKWPIERAGNARRALLRQPEFRRAWESERALDRRLGEWRESLDLAVAASGATRRIRERALARVASSPFAGLDWRRIAAAMLVAGLLGGALDFVVSRDAGAGQDVALLDPLYAIDPSELQ
jgi:hypothetical protein